MIIEKDVFGSGVYKISHPDTNKIYVGSAEELLGRAETHEWMIRTDVHHSKNLRLFAKKVDKALFKFSVIEKVNNILELEEREQFYLDNLLKANENNANFFRLGLNGDRFSTRNSGCNGEKPVLQYSLKGKFIREWRSALIASKELKINYTSIIQAALGNIENFKRAGKFQWKPYVENYPLIISEYINPHLQRILLYNKEGVFLKELPSFASIKRELNIARSSVVKSCEKGILVNNFRFKYYTENFPVNIGEYKYYLSKNIYVYKRKTGEFIGIFDSFMEIKREIKVSAITASRKLNKIDDGWCKYIFYTEPLSQEFLNNLKNKK